MAGKRMGLTDQQIAFAELLRDNKMSARKAASLIGCSSASARTIGPRWLKLREVQAIISGAKTTKRQQKAATATRKTTTQSDNKPATSSSRPMVGICQLPGWDEEEKKQTQMGRPSLYSHEMSEEILDVLAHSIMSLEKVCESDDRFPSVRTVYKWLNENEDFSQRYARARDRQGEFCGYKALEVAFDDSEDIGFKEDGTPFAIRENIGRSKLKIDTLFRAAGKLSPKKWGDKPENMQAAAADALTELLRSINERTHPLDLIEESVKYRMIELNPKEKDE